jgi:CRP/FNR family transcriptional regulator, cyclic AMP receptor protein
VVPVTRGNSLDAHAPDPQHFGRRMVSILDVDDELARAVPSTRRRQASEVLRVSVIEAPKGSLRPPTLDPLHAYGLLMLDGLIAQRLRVADASATEILGPGDILRPWEAHPVQDEALHRFTWHTLEPAQLAVLDERLTPHLGRWPTLSVALSGRLLRRTRNLSYLLALSHLSRLEDRLLGTLWHLATNWGRVTPRGVTVPVKLTHNELGEMVGARRSSVTIALKLLRDRHLISRRADGSYLVCGDPPAWLPPPPS